MKNLNRLTLGIIFSGLIASIPTQVFALQAPINANLHTSTVGEKHFVVNSGKVSGSDKAAPVVIFNTDGTVNLTSDTFVGMTTTPATASSGSVTATGTPANLNYVPAVGIASAVRLTLSGSGCEPVSITSVDSKGNPTAVNYNASIQLSNSAGSYWSDSLCRVHFSSISTISSGTNSVSTPIYFKASGSATLAATDITGSSTANPQLNTGSAVY